MTMAYYIVQKKLPTYDVRDGRTRENGYCGVLNVFLKYSKGKYDISQLRQDGESKIIASQAIQGNLTSGVLLGLQNVNQVY